MVRRQRFDVLRSDVAPMYAKTVQCILALEFEKSVVTISDIQQEFISQTNNDLESAEMKKSIQKNSYRIVAKYVIASKNVETE